MKTSSIGESNPFFGKRHSETTKNKIRIKRKGQKHSPESRKKMSLSQMGHKGYWSGKSQSEITRKKISATQRVSGGANWQGGKTGKSITIRHSLEYRLWRESIFKRDNYTCVWCGQRGGRINADHIRPFSIIIKDNNIISLENALECDELWDVNNGRTLCIDCHKKTETYGSRVIKLLSLVL